MQITDLERVFWLMMLLIDIKGLASSSQAIVRKTVHSRRLPQLSLL
jgi:hypothetical protein